ncbi:MAG: class I SAM-dependent rRNA methyltransferase [Ignavibacteriales bacterium]|nr:class I SAM-dependent rRNA methyltransferase [Ignavibacteriales bacterium]
MTKKIILRKNEEKRILQGHLWVFSNEVQKVEGNPENGDIVMFVTHSGSFLGSGFYNKQSLIAGRILSRSEVSDVRAHITHRLNTAYQLRSMVCSGRESFRLVHSESDLLPGLIIDKYNSTFVLQFNSAGMHKLHQMIVDILVSEFKAVNVLCVNDARLMEMEGITPLPEVLFGEAGSEIVSDGKVRYKVDFSTAQKTGLFLDQVENRKYAAGLAENAFVLDAFCNSGGFGINALLAGAAKVDFVDSSKNEIENVKVNLAENGITDTDKYAVFTEDMFDFMEKKVSEGIRYDVVMIDQHSFAKSRKSIPVALKAYQKMHRLALLALKPYGYLCTSSCSYHTGYDDYLETVAHAARKTGRTVQLIHSCGAGPDHPVLPSMPETAYLKFMVFRVGEDNS